MKKPKSIRERYRALEAQHQRIYDAYMAALTRHWKHRDLLYDRMNAAETKMHARYARMARPITARVNALQAECSHAPHHPQRSRCEECGKWL